MSEMKPPQHPFRLQTAIVIASLDGEIQVAREAVFIGLTIIRSNGVALRAQFSPEQAAALRNAISDRLEAPLGLQTPNSE